LVQCKDGLKDLDRRCGDLDRFGDCGETIDCLANTLQGFLPFRAHIVVCVARALVKDSLECSS
jgi:hypothetical protein